MHTLDVVLPAEMLDVFISKLETMHNERRDFEIKARAKAADTPKGGATNNQANDLKHGRQVGGLEYAKVMLGLKNLLEPEFLDAFVKKGMASFVDPFHCSTAFL